jgi:hypothetical protein
MCEVPVTRHEHLTTTRAQAELNELTCRARAHIMTSCSLRSCTRTSKRRAVDQAWATWIRPCYMLATRNQFAPRTTQTFPAI